jgi:hypothetical protein
MRSPIAPTFHLRKLNMAGLHNNSDRKEHYKQEATRTLNNIDLLIFTFFYFYLVRGL